MSSIKMEPVPNSSYIVEVGDTRIYFDLNGEKLFEQPIQESAAMLDPSAMNKARPRVIRLVHIDDPEADILQFLDKSENQISFIHWGDLPFEKETLKQELKKRKYIGVDVTYVIQQLDMIRLEDTRVKPCEIL